MAEIVNLRRARKARDRAGREATAEINRAKFGRPKAERVLEAAGRRQAEARLDAHRLDTNGPDDTNRHDS